MLLVLVLGIAYFFYLLSPASELETEKNFSVSPGTGINEIAALLQSQGLIRSARIFKFYSFLSGSAHILKPGSYSLSLNLSVPEVVKRLVNGPLDIEVLIAEGRSLKDIDRFLASLGLIKEGTLVNSSLEEFKSEFPFLKNANTLEGFLFPDTYRISRNSELSTIIKKFLTNFSEKAILAFGPSVFQNEDSNWYQDLIIASLIEREIPAGDDRKLVAGILRRRLVLDMPLQVDATVVYVKCGGRYENCPPLTKSDFKLKSPYNTYYRKGLPPTPIANPGLDALIVARQPKNSDFLYYLSDPNTGKTVFSRTLEEHNTNRARYLPFKNKPLNGGAFAPSPSAGGRISKETCTYNPNMLT